MSLSKRFFYFNDFKENNFNFYPDKTQLKQLLDKINKEKKQNEFPGRPPPEKNNDGIPSIKINCGTSVETEGELRNDIDNKTIDTNNTNNKEPSGIKQQYNKRKNKMKSFFNCMSKYKNYSKAHKFISDQLDIVAYIRNNMLLNIIKKCLLGSNRKEIIKLLSIPVISLKDNKNEHEDDLFRGKTDKYKEYNEEDFENCKNEIDKQKKENNFDNNFNLYVKEHLEKVLTKNN